MYALFLKEITLLLFKKKLMSPPKSEHLPTPMFDDVIDFSETWKAHLVHLREVLT